MDEIKILVNQHNPYIIGVVETWLPEENMDCEIDLPQYNFIR